MTHEVRVLDEDGLTDGFQIVDLSGKKAPDFDGDSNDVEDDDASVQRKRKKYRVNGKHRLEAETREDKEARQHAEFLADRGIEYAVSLLKVLVGETLTPGERKILSRKQNGIVPTETALVDFLDWECRRETVDPALRNTIALLLSRKQHFERSRIRVLLESEGLDSSMFEAE